jgi:HAD superfamily hydrolase (TIGR01509 family)
VKAFIFDMDGVLIDSETVWQKRDTGFFGKEVNEQIQDQLLGSTVQTIYKLACAHGLVMPEDEFYRRYDELAISVYAEAKLTAGLDQLLETLEALEFKIGLVSSSPRLWIDYVLARIGNREVFDYILSISDSPQLRSKPAPDGYIRAMNMLGSTPEQTIVLEDSNNGIAAAKASGAFVIGLREHVAPAYTAKGADKYVQNLAQLETYVRGQQS